MTHMAQMTSSQGFTVELNPIIFQMTYFLTKQGMNSMKKNRTFGFQMEPD